MLVIFVLACANGLTWKGSHHNQSAKIGISLHCQLQQEEAMWKWCAFLGNVCYNIIYNLSASWNFDDQHKVRVDLHT